MKSMKLLKKIVPSDTRTTYTTRNLPLTPTLSHEGRGRQATNVRSSGFPLRLKELIKGKFPMGECWVGVTRTRTRSLEKELRSFSSWETIRSCSQTTENRDGPRRPFVSIERLSFLGVCRVCNIPPSPQDPRTPRNSASFPRSLEKRPCRFSWRVPSHEGRGRQATSARSLGFSPPPL